MPPVAQIQLGFFTEGLLKYADRLCESQSRKQCGSPHLHRQRTQMGAGKAGGTVEPTLGNAAGVVGKHVLKSGYQGKHRSQIRTRHL